jgi:hypothetical protein
LGFDLEDGSVGPGFAAGDELLHLFGVDLAPLRLKDNIVVLVLDAEPLQAILNRLGMPFLGAFGVGVLDSQEERTVRRLAGP